MSTEGMWLGFVDDALKGAMDDGAERVELAEVRRLVAQVEASMRTEYDRPGRGTSDATLATEIFRSQAAIGVKKQEAERAEGHAWDLKLFDSVIAHGQASLKAIFLVAGGSAAAVLAFMGHLVTEKAPSEYVHAAVSGVEWFGAALVAATLAQGLTWLSQALYARERSGGDRWRAWGDRTRNIVAALGFGAIVMVCVGIQQSAAPFVHYAPPAPVPCAPAAVR
jgi:hypothetical protein